MPKVTQCVRNESLKEEFPEFDIRDGNLFCTYCQKNVSFFGSLQRGSRSINLNLCSLMLSVTCECMCSIFKLAMFSDKVEKTINTCKNIAIICITMG